MSAANSVAKLPAAFDEFDVVVDVPVRFHDVDLMQHVHHGVYLDYFEEARAKLYTDGAGVRSIEDAPFVIASFRIRYESPLYLGETVRASCRLTRIGTRSFSLSYQASEVGSGRLVATAESEQVWVDLRRRVSVAPPQAVLERLLTRVAPAR